MVQVSKICANHSLQGFPKAELVRVAPSEVVHFQHSSDILQLTGLSVPVTQKFFCTMWRFHGLSHGMDIKELLNSQMSYSLL